MNKPTKIILCITAVLVLCGASLFAGYKFGEKSNKSDVIDAEQVYITQLKDKLTSLSELLTAYKILRDKDQELYSLRSEYRKLDVDSDEYKEKVEAIEQLFEERITMNNLYDGFGKEYIQSILSSMQEVRALAKSAAEYTNDKAVIEQAEDFAVALSIVSEVMDNGIALDGELICYGFAHYNQLREDGESEFLQKFYEDILYIIGKLDSSFLCLSDFSLKYSSENIIDTLSGFKLDKGEYVEEVYNNSSRIKIDFIIEYTKGEVINFPKLTVRSLGAEATALMGTGSWNNGTGDSAAPIVLLGRYKPQLYLYEGDLFRLRFNVEPLEYTIYELKDDGTEIETDYQLHEYIKMQANDVTAKYVVRAKWAQGGAFYTFQIGLKEPADWSEYEKAK